MPLHLNADSDDELFSQAGGRKPISLYSLTQDAPASSDEEDNSIFETPAKRPRGRPKNISTPLQLPPKEKKPKTTILEISDDDDDDQPPEQIPQQELDEHDRTISATLAHARAVLAEGDEDALAREAEAEVQRERAIREREEAEKRMAVEEQKRRKEAQIERARKEKEAREARARGESLPEQNVDAIYFQLRMDETRKIRVRIRRTDPLMKMLPAFCKRFELLPKDVVMRVDGEDVGEKDTAETLDCENDMQIDFAMRRR